jgi:hypothetical protein
MLLLRLLIDDTIHHPIVRIPSRVREPSGGCDLPLAYILTHWRVNGMLFGIMYTLLPIRINSMQ